MDVKLVRLFDKTHVYFASGDNKREVRIDVDLPAHTKAFDTVKLNVDLDCPNRRCDWWDRRGAIYLENEVGTEIEIFRFMTPYRVGAEWQLDVSNLLPLLSGKRSFKVFIDTWVGPGHPQGDGWLVDATLEYSLQGQAQRPIVVLPVFKAQSRVYGDPEVEPKLKKVLNSYSHATSGKLVSHVTGHGQGNTENCAEFCPKKHTFSVNENSKNLLLWRDNCKDTRTDGPQQGTWIYSRAGWCPGDKVEPIILDIVKEEAQPWKISWTPEAYMNQRNGDYDNGRHTKPYYQVSSYLVVYE